MKDDNVTFGDNEELYNYLLGFVRSRKNPAISSFAVGARLDLEAVVATKLLQCPSTIPR
jgi:hypothetical protein